MKLVVLTTAPDGVTAAIVKGVVEAAGIPVMLRAYQAAGWLFPGSPSSFGATEVLVPAERLAEARRALAAAREGSDRLGEAAAEADQW